MTPLAGTAPAEKKLEILRVCEETLWERDNCFATYVAKNVRFVRLDLDEDPDAPKLEGQESVRGRVLKVHTRIDVSQDMCNYQNVMHAGCAAFLVDMLTIFEMNKTVSLNLNLTYHRPAKLGSTLHIVSTIVHLGKVHSGRVQIYDLESGQLLITGQHSRMVPSGPRPLHLPNPATIEPKALLVSQGPISQPWVRAPKPASPEQIGGNAPQSLKDSIWDMVENWEKGGPFALEVGKRVWVREVNESESDEKAKRRREMVCEVEVTELMTNETRNFHGACACFLVARLPPTMRYLEEQNRVTTNINVSFHAPVPLGTIVKIVVVGTTSGKQVSYSHVEMRDARTGKLLVSGTHTQVGRTLPGQDGPAPRL